MLLTPTYWDYQLVINYIEPLARKGTEPFASYLAQPKDSRVPRFADPDAISTLVVGGEKNAYWYATDFQFMKTVRIADLKARLSEHLRSVRKGRTLTVLDRDTPIARIIPYTVEPVEVRRAARPLRDLKLPPSPAKPTDSLAVLLEDRRRR